MTRSAATSQPSAVQPAAGQRSTGQRSTGQRSAGQRSAGQRSTGQRSTGQRSAGQRSAVQQRPVSGKTRRRGAALETALLDAAWDELQATGYAGLTMEAVADRAGTSRAVLYRRWSSKPELVIATLRRYRPMLSGEVPDTGSLRSDVLALLRRMSARLAEVGPETVYGVLGDYFADAELFSRVQDQVLHIGAGVMADILKRAADRGEARADVKPVIAALPTDLFRQQIFLTRTPPAEEILTQIVDDVFLPLVRP
jgi:AcrR family transcriptional regulator